MLQLLFLFVPFFSLLSQNSESQKLSTFHIYSEQLQEDRTINYWLPKDTDSFNTNLPVLFVLDGGVKEDFLHVMNTVSELIETKRIKPLVLIGIENTQRRRDLTPPTTVKKDSLIAPEVGKSAIFRAFLSQELFPNIQKRFNPKPDFGILGESLAGLFVFETVVENPTLFQHYIAFDPSLWWNNGALTKKFGDMLNQQNEFKQSLWFASSNAKDIYKNTRKIKNTLQEAAPKSLVWQYNERPKETHASIFQATKIEALTWTYK